MSRNCNHRRMQQQRRVAQQARSVEADDFFNLLTGELLLPRVEAQLPEHRERRYPPTVTLSMFLGQVMSADGSCQSAVNKALVSRVLSGMDVGSARTGGYCLARQRLPEPMVRALGQESAALLNARTPQKWLWRGRPVKLVDGTTMSLPDSAPNQARFPQHGAAQPGAGFPLARLVGVICLSHGAVLNAAMGPYKGKGSGEHGLLRQLLECFAPGDVVLADAYFTSYFLIADLQARGVDVLFEQHGGRGRRSDFRRGQKLGARDHLVQWGKPAKTPWMSEEQYQAYPQQLSIREVKVGKKVLVSTLLQARQIPKAALGELFTQRWNVELDLRNIKTTLGMESLSCRTPQMCEKELWVYLLAYNLIRLLMAQAAGQANLLPRQLSFKHTLQIWQAWSQRQFLSIVAQDTATLFKLIAQIRVGNRPGRLEPRAVKTRPKTFPRLNKPRWQARAQIRRYGHPRET